MVVVGASSGIGEEMGDFVVESSRGGVGEGELVSVTRSEAEPGWEDVPD